MDDMVQTRFSLKVIYLSVGMLWIFCRVCEVYVDHDVPPYDAECILARLASISWRGNMQSGNVRTKKCHVCHKFLRRHDLL